MRFGTLNILRLTGKGKGGRICGCDKAHENRYLAAEWDEVEGIGREGTGKGSEVVLILAVKR